MQRPYLIFDKSSLESLNIDEAVLLDTFFSCVITPIFFVECLADLEKEIRSKSTPVQLGDQRGVIFQQTKERKAMQRWTAREFLEAERQIAKAWRKSLTSIDFD